MSEVWRTLKLPSVELPLRHIYLFTQSSSNEYQIFTWWWPFKDPNMFWNSFSKNTRQFYLDSWYNHNIVLTYDALLININLPILLNATYHSIVNMYTNSFKELYVVVTETDCWYQLFEQNISSHWHINNYKPMWRNDGNLHWWGDCVALRVANPRLEITNCTCNHVTPAASFVSLPSFFSKIRSVSIPLHQAVTAPFFWNKWNMKLR
jgi:hypothetical protein